MRLKVAMKITGQNLMISNSKKIDDVNLIKYVIKLFINKEKDGIINTNDSKNSDINEKGLISSLIILIKEKTDLCHDYEEISRIIYNLANNDFNCLRNFFGLNEDGNNLGSDYEVLIQQYKDKIDSSKENLNRFVRHIKLSCYQREYMDRALKKAEEAKKISKEAKKTSEEAKSNAKSTKKLAGTAKKKINGMYSEFVSILAIFTAMSFAMMGSVQALGNLFKDIRNPTQLTLAYALIIGGIYLIILYAVIMMLVMSIKKLFDNSILSQKYTINYGFTILIIITSIGFITLGFALLNRVSLHMIVFHLLLVAFIICTFLLYLMLTEKNDCNL